LSRIAPICASSSSSPTTSVWLRSRRRDRTSSCIGRGWTNAGSLRRLSNGVCRRSAATTASCTSTAASLRILPSTCGGHMSIRQPSAAWTAVSWPRSCTPRSEPHRCTPASRCCTGSTGSESARHVARTSRTSASNAAIEPCRSSATATSLLACRSCPEPHERWI
jgi:hypothetical protein